MGGSWKVTTRERYRAPGTWEKEEYVWGNLHDMQIHRKLSFASFTVNQKLTTKTFICLRGFISAWLFDWNQPPHIQFKNSSTTKTPCRMCWERDSVAGTVSAASAFGDYISKTVDCYFWLEKWYRGSLPRKQSQCSKGKRWTCINRPVDLLRNCYSQISGTLRTWRLLDIKSTKGRTVGCSSSLS